EDAAREDAERLRRRGPVRRLREAAFAALFCLVAVVLPVGASGLVDSYEGTVHAREHENHHMGSRSHTSYHLVLDPPARVEVPKVVHDAAAPGVRVRKRFGAPWWTFAGRPCFGPAAVGFTAALLGVLFATWVHFRRDPDLAHVVAIVTVFTAWLCGWATEVTAGGGLAPAVTLGAGLLLVARVLRSGPRRRAA
ncbi:MAG: hypothetical protein KIT58_12440, partial [Planctomycetota bacterium]|nr:hypothetical protein [Planctomycetota bacterium]